MGKEGYSDLSHNSVFIFSHVLCRDLQPCFLFRMLLTHTFIICILLEKNNADQIKYNFKVIG